MAATGFDHDRRHRLDGEHLAVQLDRPFPSQNQIDLRHFLVIMGPGIFLDIDLMDRRDAVSRRGKGPAREAARTTLPIDLIQLRDDEVGF